MLDIFTLPLSDEEDEMFLPGVLSEPSRFPVSEPTFPVDIDAGLDSVTTRNIDVPYVPMCEAISPASEIYNDLTEDIIEESIDIAQVDFDFLLDNEINNLLAYPTDNSPSNFSLFYPKMMVESRPMLGSGINFPSTVQVEKDFYGAHQVIRVDVSPLNSPKIHLPISFINR